MPLHEVVCRKVKTYSGLKVLKLLTESEREAVQALHVQPRPSVHAFNVTRTYHFVLRVAHDDVLLNVNYLWLAVAVRWRNGFHRAVALNNLSIVQDEIGQEFCPYRKFSVVVDQSHCSEFVHEVRDASPGRAHHFGQGLVTQYGDTGIRRDIMCP